MRHLSVADTIGVFEDFSGELYFDNGRILRLVGTLNIDSINTFNEARDSELRESDFFSKKEARLESISFRNGILRAWLSMNGVTRNVDFKVAITGPVRNPSLDIKDNKKDVKNPLINEFLSGSSGVNSDMPFKNPHFSVDSNGESGADSKADCGCYVSYGDNVLGLVLESKINRFDFNISPTTPKELLGEFVSVKIIIEASK